MLLSIGQPNENERDRMTQPTEKTYDLCRLAGYVVRSEYRGRTTYIEMAVRTVLGCTTALINLQEFYDTAIEITKTLRRLTVFGEVA